MYRRIAIAGVTAAAIAGVGTAALATSGADTTTGTAKAANAKSTHANHHNRHALLRHTLHGQITTKGKDGYVTHSAIRGSVTSASATSITVKALDGYSQTFVITSATKIRERGAGKGKGTPGTVSDVKSGDKVGVLGKGPDKSTDDPTATVVVDGLRK